MVICGLLDNEKLYNQLESVGLVVRFIAWLFEPTLKGSLDVVVDP